MSILDKAFLINLVLACSFLFLYDSECKEKLNEFRIRFWPNFFACAKVYLYFSLATVPAFIILTIANK